MSFFERTKFRAVMKKILIVEDELITQLDLAGILSPKGYTIVKRVNTGEAAIEAFHKFKPDIIIMDVHLKGKMTGIDAAKEIVQFANPFFIFLSGDEYEMYLRGTGIKYVYLKKPFAENELLNLLNSFADKS